MLYALSETGEKILPKKYEHALCPCCKSVVIAKCGEIYYHHWAHKSNKNCDEWYESESDWHLKWKSLFPKENVEVTITKDGKYHRADVIGRKGMIIELQHSSISTTVIREREVFYENMLWIFDRSHKQGNFEAIDQINGREFSFSWQTPIWSLIACKKPFYFDNGKELLICVTKLYYKRFTGYFIDKDEFILEHGGLLQPIT